MLKKFYIDFFRNLKSNSNNISDYVDSLYEGHSYSEGELNQIFGVLKREGLIFCVFADNRAYNIQLTVEGNHYFDDETIENNIPRLIELINDTDNVEKEFHIVGGEKGFFAVEQIHDSQVFQNWIQELKFELLNLFSNTNDGFIKDTIDLVSNDFNGFNDKKLFKEIKAKLDVISRNQAKYFKDNIETQGAENGMNKNKPPLIFISHSSSNKESVKLLTDLLVKLRLEPQKHIFCSSIPGFDIPIDYENGIFDFLRECFTNYSIHAIFVHSPEYYSSSVSMNEMGAAWVLKTTQTSFLLPGFSFDKMTGVINGSRIATKLDADIIEVKDKLNQLRKQLEQEFSLEPIKDIIWEEARDRFIKEINDIPVRDEDKA